jgi:hypothetical protein
MPSVVLNQIDPLGLAAQAVGEVNDKRRQADLDSQASSRANAQLALQTQAGARDQTRLTDEEAQTGVVNARESAAADLRAKQEAYSELDRTAATQLAFLKEENAKTKNDQDFAYKSKQLSQALALAKANIQKGVGVANINASAKLGAANIAASAHAEAAGISAGAKERDQDIRHEDAVAGRAVTKRGQDLTVKRTQALQHKAIMATAVARLGKTKGAPPVPTDDPQLNETMADFHKMTPEQRDEFLNAKKPDGTPAIPASTHAYLQALSPVYGALGH